MPPRLYRFYCDESSHRRERYFFFGGLLIESQNVPSLSEKFANLRHDVGLGREIKWGKASKYHLKAYKQIADFYFVHAGLLRFRVLRVDSNQLSDWRQFSDSYNQMMDKIQNSFLAYQCGQLLGHDDSCDVIVDQRQSEEELRKILHYSNSKLRTRCGYPRDVLTSITAVDSKEYWQIQLVDLLLGALGYKANEMYGAAGAAPHRIALMEHILERLAFRSLDLPIGGRGSHTAYWPFDIAKSKRR